MSPYDELQDFIFSYVDENKLDQSLKKEVPKKWEKYGDFVLFDGRTFCSEVWKCESISFWENIAMILKCKRLGIKNKIQNNVFRSPNVTILLGKDPWIMHKDNSILYTWHVLHNMFSAGNASERHRIAKFKCENEIVVDMFAGIGYFTLPYLIHAKAGFVHACEWNPVACEALRRNLSLNKVSDRCIIHEGDNKLVCPKKIANRINLGLIPSSENYWELACEVLSEKGGILHIHENIEVTNSKLSCQNCAYLIGQIDCYTCQKNLMMTTNKNSIEEGIININWKHKEWLVKGLHILHSISSILKQRIENKEWNVLIQEINFIKSYAPKVHHLVYDINVESTL